MKYYQGVKLEQDFIVINSDIIRLLMVNAGYIVIFR